MKYHYRICPLMCRSPGLLQHYKDKVHPQKHCSHRLVYRYRDKNRRLIHLRAIPSISLCRCICLLVSSNTETLAGKYPLHLHHRQYTYRAYPISHRRHISDPDSRHINYLRDLRYTPLCIPLCNHPNNYHQKDNCCSMR